MSHEQPPQIHPTALVETSEIGGGTRIWAFAHILPGAIVGKNCNIGDGVFIESGARVGDNVTIKNGVCIWKGIAIEDDVFVGPAVAFTNDRRPRSPRMEQVQTRYAHEDSWLERTLVQHGCSIGANATVLPGLTLGRYSMIAAGAVVTRDVAAHALVVGSPSRAVGFVCRCGQAANENQLICPTCHDQDFTK